MARAHHLTLFLALTFGYAVTSSAHPRMPALASVSQRLSPALVRVFAGTTSATGFFVTSSGVALTALPNVREGDDVVVELLSGERRSAHVVDSGHGVAVLVVKLLPKDGAMVPSLALATRVDTPTSSSWLVGLDSEGGALKPALGGVRRVDDDGRWHLDLPLGAGAPVLIDDVVVAIVLARVGTTASTAVSIDGARHLLAHLAPRAQP